MKLPKFLQKENLKEYYLALILRNEKVTSVIFEKDQGAIRYINSAEQYFPNTIEDATGEQFLDCLDKAITRAETALPENVETHKTLFGLKESWIEEDKIKKEYLDKLKKASSELSLDPIGFLAYTESIVNLVQKDEGAPITAVLADIGKKYITVSLVKSGKVVETKSSEIHESASYTVDTLLKHFQTPEVMPARIIIVDSEEDELTQEFLNHNWSKSLPFLHVPQIISLPEDASTKAMLLGAATKMGGKLFYDNFNSGEDEMPVGKKVDKEDSKVKEIANESAADSEEKEKLDYVGEDTSTEFFGFLEGEDIAKVPEAEVIEQANKEDLTKAEVEQNFEEVPEQVKENQEKNTLPVNAGLAFTKFKNTLPKIFSFFGRIKINKNSIKNFTSNRNYLIATGVILLLLILFFGFNLLGKSASVNVIVSASQDQKDTSVTFSPNSSTDISSSIISVSNISVSEEGTVSEKTTGKKDVGEKGKGSVTIFNNSSSTVVFSSGTEINSSNNLTFTLDSSVTVASSTGDIFSGTKPGTATVNVTAEDIGQEYNLPSGTKFSIGSNSDVAAKNDNAFSGGTKKSITVVSKDDLAKALADLPKNLESKAKDELKSKSQDGRQILNGFTNETIESQSFDKKVDDQATSITLKGTVNYETVSFSNKDIEALASSLFNSGDFVVSAKNLTVDAKNIGLDKNGDITADITIKANIYPKIDTSNLSKDIAGASLTKAKNIILNVNQVKSVDIKLSPNIPFFSGSLPSNPNKIKIDITSN